MIMRHTGEAYPPGLEKDRLIYGQRL